MPQSKKSGLALFLLAAVLGTFCPAWGQEVTAAIVGTVTDPSGAPLRGAAVTANDTDRGSLWTATTNDSGSYNLARLPVGNYGVKVSAPGFDTAVRPPITLVLNQTAHIDFQLKVGQVSTTVEVTSAAPVLQTESAQVSTVMDARTNDDLPLATRNYIQLTLLSPGAISVDPKSFNTGASTAEIGRASCRERV